MIPFVQLWHAFKLSANDKRFVLYKKKQKKKKKISYNDNRNSDEEQHYLYTEKYHKMHNSIRVW